MAPYSPTVWINSNPPPLSAANLNKLTDELESQAAAKSISHSLPTWADGVAPALTDAAPLNEMERVAAAVATAIGSSYTPTTWSSGWTPSRNAARFNKLEQQAFANRVAIDATPTGNPYFNMTYSPNHDYRLPWTTLFSYTQPGYVDVGLYGGPPATSSPEGRVAVVSAPWGGGEYASRHEIQNSDPYWNGLPNVQKAEVRTLTDYTMNKPTCDEGDERWFSLRFWMPDNAQERFEWPTSGADTFFTIFDLHPGSSSMGGAISMEWYAGGNPKWASMRIQGGNPASLPGATSAPLWQLTNSNGSYYAPNYNRVNDLVFGVRFASDSTGWFEGWFNGVNVYPRAFLATKYAGDSGAYFKHGLYKTVGATFPTGKSIIYYGRVLIGMTRADVG